MKVAIALAAAYLLGSIPWAYIAGRFKGVDLRKFGSGNLGTTNVLRLLGVPAALIVYALDALKGALPVLLFPGWFGFPERGLWAILCGCAAILGHVRPIFLMWKGGGKGVATASGVFFALTPLPAFASFIGFVFIMVTTRRMSLASLTGAVIVPLGVALTNGPDSLLFAVSSGVSAFVFWTHRANIGRLRRGEEPKLSFRRSDEKKSPDAIDGLTPQGRT